MANSSSELTVRFSRRPSSFALALRDSGGGAERGTNRFDLKELQRRAFERGRQVERDRVLGPLSELGERLASWLVERERERAAERVKLEEFGVRLALAVAERLVGASVRDGRHDVRAMVAELIEGSGLRAEAGEARLVLAPGDRDLLLEGLGGRTWAGPPVSVDENLAAGEARIEGGDGVSWTRLSERLETLRSRLLEESRRVDA